ncbi:MAG: hypothetical protein HY744_33125 [Deltaproteobacteria bacterium]|nr:hypothetical protein [Deltaproteobacteria bacterium]
MYPPPPEPGGEKIGTAADKLTNGGMERLIPLRFVHVLNNCSPFCQPNLVAWERTLRDIQHANQVFKSIGVQLWIRAIDGYDMPDLADVASPGEVSWDLVKDELKQVFSSMPLDAWPGASKTREDWLRASAAVYAAEHEILVWVQASKSTSVGQFPEGGRSVLMYSGTMTSEPFKLAHELGHFLGLRHTWEGPGGGDDGVDPPTLQARKLSDRWDLVYTHGSNPSFPNIYYDSRAEAAADESSIELIQKRPCPLSSCGAADSCLNTNPAAPGELVCHVGDDNYYETLVTGAVGLKGLAFAFASGAVGPNVMTYRGDWNTHPYGVSDSQIELVRKYLRWDVPITAGGILNDFNPNYAYTLTSRRPSLGNWNLRAPSSKLDFDGDGKRDIGVWLPPTSLGGTGRFIVLLSSHSFSEVGGEYLDVAFGRNGDISVPADYTGEGRTDVAVFQPGGGDPYGSDPYSVDAYWRWCPTASPAESTTCTSPQQRQYGRRGDIPQPGLEFGGDAGDDFSVYRPSGGTWHFRSSSGSINTQRSIGTANAGVVPLAGLYDCDSLADLAVYEPQTAKFRLRRSEQTWNTLTTREFGADFVPAPDAGTPAEERSGALPLADIYAPRSCYVYPYWFTRARRSAALFVPNSDGNYAATWNIMWTPVESDARQDCQYGNGAIDQPITNIDRNADKRTEMSVFRAQSFDDPGTIYIRNSVLGACNGENRNVSCSDCPRIRRRVFGVSDMTGDGKAEILMVQPDSMTICWFTSESDYATKQCRFAGSQWPAELAWAVVL